MSLWLKLHYGKVNIMEKLFHFFALEQLQKGKSSKKSKKKRKVRPHARQIAEAQAMHYLTGGYYKVIVFVCRGAKCLLKYIIGNIYKFKKNLIILFYYIRMLIIMNGCKKLLKFVIKSSILLRLKYKRGFMILFTSFQVCNKNLKLKF